MLFCKSTLLFEFLYSNILNGDLICYHLFSDTNEFFVQDSLEELTRPSLTKGLILQKENSCSFCTLIYFVPAYVEWLKKCFAVS